MKKHEKAVIKASTPLIIITVILVLIGVRLLQDYGLIGKADNVDVFGFLWPDDTEVLDGDWCTTDANCPVAVESKDYRVMLPLVMR